MIPGIIIAGTHSGVGKTTIALGIMSLFVKAGFIVQGYKVGPDYIDPSFYKGITGRPAENLDSWMTNPAEVKRIYNQGSQHANFAVVEGVMGLFDGIHGDSDAGSTAEIAKILGLPVILVVDARSMARSIAPLLKGFLEFDTKVQFGGIVFNRVGSDRHRQILTKATQSVTDVKILGFLNKDTLLSFPERHLGLAPFYENKGFQSRLAGFADIFEKIIDLNDLLETNPIQSGLNCDQSFDIKEYGLEKPAVKIAIARDEAFGFYYQDNIRLLQQAGADLIPFSPLKDLELPPDLDGLYLGGGYPELFAEPLSLNKSMREAVNTIIGKGLPTYAECGGLMYLSERIHTPEGTYPMVGALKLEVEMTPRREALGYCEVRALTDNILLERGQNARGHEFHYSRIIKSLEEPSSYVLTKNDETIKDGYSSNNLLASYVHLHFASQRGIAERFVTKCREYKNNLKTKELEALNETGNHSSLYR